MGKEKRFEVIEKDMNLGFGTSASIICDNETGVQYLIASTGFGGGITILLDKDGKPLLR